MVRVKKSFVSKKVWFFPKTFSKKNSKFGDTVWSATRTASLHYPAGKIGLNMDGPVHCSMCVRVHAPQKSWLAAVVARGPAPLGVPSMRIPSYMTHGASYRVSYLIFRQRKKSPPPPTGLSGCICRRSKNGINPHYFINRVCLNLLFAGGRGHADTVC